MLVIITLLTGALCLATKAAAPDPRLPPRLQLQDTEGERGPWRDLEDPDEEDEFANYRPEEHWPPGGVGLPPSPPVTLNDGVVTGQNFTLSPNRYTFAYQGIPFGEPTNGSLRFMVRIGRGVVV